MAFKLKNLFWFSVVSAIFIVCTGCSNKVPALFETKEEAERAASEFDCIGAHKMGNKWMPCMMHNDSLDHHNH